MKHSTRDLKQGIGIGIEATGTRTVGILVDAEGRELLRAQSGGANPWDVGVDAARASLKSVLDRLTSAGSVKAVCLGSAGVDSDADRLAAETMLRGLVPRDTAIVVKNDAAAALGIVGAKRPAMVVIADTGSIAYGENAEGKPMRIGGHGAVIGDRGSATEIGLCAIRHVANVLDGSEPQGALSQAVIKETNVRRAGDIAEKILTPQLDVPRVAALAPLVQRALEAGDAVARGIVEREGDALAAQAKRLAFLIRAQSALPALLAGQIFSAFPDIRERVKAQLRQTGAVVVHETSETVHGAARLAAELARS